jgi:predicted transcriptional regulator
LSGADAPTGRITLVLNNTGTADEVVILTFQRTGGTARRFRRLVFAENEGAVIRGIPIQPDDTLLGVTTTASVVDYLVSTGSGDITVDVLSADGTSKGVATLRKILLGMEDLVGTEMVDPG